MPKHLSILDAIAGAAQRVIVSANRESRFQYGPDHAWRESAWLFKWYRQNTINGPCDRSTVF
jgi:hypothetical protein